MLRRLAPPILSEHDTKRKAVLLTIILWTVAGLVNIAILYSDYSFPGRWARWLMIGGILNAGTIIFHLLNRRNYTQIVSWLVVPFYCLMIYGSAWLGGGMGSAGLHFAPLPVLVASLLLGWEAGIVTGLSEGALGFWIAIRQQWGLHPTENFQQDPVYLAISIFFVIIVIMILQYLSTSSLNSALKRVNEELERRKATEDALRASQENFLTIFKASPEAIMLSRLDDFRIVDVNDTFCTLSAFAPEEVIGKTTVELGLWEDENERSNALRMLTDEGHFSNPEARFRMKNGSKITAMLSGKVISLHGVSHFITVVHDVTELKRVQEIAKSHERQMIENEKMASIGLLASGVAHEINNPNNYLLLNAKILERAWNEVLPILDEHSANHASLRLAGLQYNEARKLMPDILQGMVQGTNRIKAIVDSLRNFSRRDTSELTQSVDLNTAVNSSLVLVANMLKKSTDRLTVDLEAELPLVKGSQQQLEQVILNLLTNACQALTSRTQAITIRTYRSGMNVVCSIGDEGRGIEAAEMSKIAEPFYTTKRESGGTGLGLSISHNIIRNHGGTLEFDSCPQRGTTATVYIPIAQ